MRVLFCAAHIKQRSPHKEHRDKRKFPKFGLRRIIYRQFPHHSSRKKMESGQEPKSWDELYNIDLMPSELFLKFREEIQGFRVGLNLEFYNAPINECQGKLVLKPLSHDRRWKFIYEPLHHDVRLVSKKIPITKFLNLQVGIGHSFELHATGWKWKLTSCLGGDGVSRIRNKTSLGVCPGVDLRFGWRADYILPEFTGAVGTGEALFNMNSGRLEASLDRIETILTHSFQKEDNVSP
ncbi:hypothetical protein L1987_53930 [Smallanthus sonchifolius]|uniref:Uncharacterized protein n=1 Tax=Smallanthus sonchifolius TaxID=185202 RepID=A0ACB9E6P5_9ASTR|nr:hypothetical protein L1987_53930 [Smallanthus sonchifolius]